MGYNFFLIKSHQKSSTTARYNQLFQTQFVLSRVSYIFWNRKKLCLFSDKKQIYIIFCNYHDFTIIVSLP